MNLFIMIFLIRIKENQHKVCLKISNFHQIKDEKERDFDGSFLEPKFINFSSNLSYRKWIYYDISHKDQSTQSLSKNIQFSSRNQIKDEKKRERERERKRKNVGD